MTLYQSYRPFIVEIIKKILRSGKYPSNFLVLVENFMINSKTHTILKWHITLGIIYVLHCSANIGPPDLTSEVRDTFRKHLT